MEIYENSDLQDLDGEIWKEIDGFDEDYFISNCGRVKSFKWGKEKILKSCKNSRGYFCVCLYKNKKPKLKGIHILMYETHIEKIPEGYVVHHKDKTKDNFLDNFEMMTIKEHNTVHHKNKTTSEKTKKLMSEHTDNKGENNPNYGKHQSEETRKLMSKQKKGENNSQSKLKNGEVWLIKKILNSDYYKSGKINQTYIGKMFKVSIQTISKIKNNKSWKHITL